MSAENEKCLNPWMGFLIILSVCIVILIGIFNEFRSGSHHARLHAKPNALTQAGFMRPNIDTQSPVQQIVF